MKERVLNLAALLAFCFFTCEMHAQITPHEATTLMYRGINLGNTLDPPTEGAWNNPPAEEYYFDDYVSAGFTSVRIPITWNEHTSVEFPYKIDSAWLARVEEIVDWGLSRNLFITINAHHEDWLKENYSDTNIERFDSIWSQIATRFKNKGERLIFEMLNEPRTLSAGLTLGQLNGLNKRILSIIRKTNPTRLVIFSGHDWANSSHLLAADIPDTNDKYLIGYYHSYDPYPFGLEGPGTYGSVADINATKTKFDQVSAWSKTHNIPVIISEFGATVKCEYNSRMFYYATVVEQALNHNVAFNAWDDGGNFGIYQRQSRKWNEIKDILINFSAKNPSSLKLSNNNGDSIRISWQNRTASNDSIFVERGLSPTNFSKIATLGADATVYNDINVEYGKTYYYRITAFYADSTDLLSYPQKITATHTSGLANNEPAKIASVFPNPAFRTISVRLNEGAIIDHLEVLGTDGRVFKELSPKDIQASIDIDYLAAGIYFIKVYSEGAHYQASFLKQQE
ncbi:MAG: cellulase family glycosylhydrolase [Bacteroidales bacterium]|nr:cellulase family glycosylhydrolase [Bacteroidales bacterium]